MEVLANLLNIVMEIRRICSTRGRAVDVEKDNWGRFVMYVEFSEHGSGMEGMNVNWVGKRLKGNRFMF